MSDSFLPAARVATGPARPPGAHTGPRSTRPETRAGAIAPAPAEAS
ncbi:hypothetical protein [Streptosporangium sp. NPDC023615]